MFRSWWKCLLYISKLREVALDLVLFYLVEKISQGLLYASRRFFDSWPCLVHLPVILSVFQRGNLFSRLHSISLVFCEEAFHFSCPRGRPVTLTFHEAGLLLSWFLRWIAPPYAPGNWSFFLPRGRSLHNPCPLWYVFLLSRYCPRSTSYAPRSWSFTPCCLWYIFLLSRYCPSRCAAFLAKVCYLHWEVRCLPCEICLHCEVCCLDHLFLMT